MGVRFQEQQRPSQIQNTKIIKLNKTKKSLLVITHSIVPLNHHSPYTQVEGQYVNSWMQNAIKTNGMVETTL